LPGKTAIFWALITPGLFCLNAETRKLGSKLADYDAYFAAVELSDAGRYSEVADALAPIWKWSPSSPLISKAAVLGARAYSELGRHSEALELLKQYYEYLPQPEGDLVAALISEAAGDKTAAAGYFQRIVYEHPLTPENAAAETALERLSSELGDAFPPPMPQAALRRAATLMKAGETGKARTELRILASQTTGLHRDLARIRAETGDYRQLAALEVASDEADAERLFLMHAAARRAGRDGEARSALLALTEKYPRSRWRLEALVSWGNHFLLSNDRDAYEPWYRACVDEFPEEPLAAYCHWKLVWSAWIRREANAQALMKEHLTRFPDSDKAGAALYFLGRYSDVIQRFPLSFYATLARKKAPAIKIAAVRPSAGFLPSSEMLLRMSRARALEAAGLSDWADFELKYAARYEEQPFVAAIELADVSMRRGEYARGIRYIKGLATGYLSMPLTAAPEKFWKLAFPLPYRRELEKNSRLRSLDANIVAALIRQESEFDPRAVSRARAYGLTQVLPSTGRQISRRLGIRRFRTDMLYQPEINLKLGTYHLKSLLEEHDGHWERTLAAYNAGKSRVREWLTWGNFREPAEFIETIPFTETRNYVQIVLRNAYIYRTLYGDKWSRLSATR
jgi:soluble lytic murein transglycosylase